MRTAVIRILAAVVLLLSAETVFAQEAQFNNDRVNKLNAFADALYQVHLHRIKGRPIRKTVTVGGYSRRPNFYEDIEYLDAETGQLLSRIRWQKGAPRQIHMIEVFFYDNQNRVRLDYLAIYMVEFRNAPHQALVNIHHRENGLAALRQFDATGETTFEKCRGDFKGKTVDLSLDVYTPDPPSDVDGDIYSACFAALPKTAGAYLNPFAAVPDMQAASTAGDLPETELVAGRIIQLTTAIDNEPENAALYIKRGNLYFMLKDFQKAVDDFDTALMFDDGLDDAYFGRGMVLGRMGDLEKGIADLSVFIERNPDSSLGYTKRGVRYIWRRDFENAKVDLLKAVELDGNNAEAHDDLGVVLAQTGDLAGAVEHFLKVIAIEPDYQKAHHNLAMTYHIAGDQPHALAAINGALRLGSESRNSLMLKATILEALGNTKEAAGIREDAEFMPQGNWSESSGIN